MGRMYMPREPKCPVCGKIYCLYSPEWAWAHDGKLLCSYHCMRVLEKQDEENAEKKRTYTRVINRHSTMERVEREIKIPKCMSLEERENMVVRMRKAHYSYDVIGTAVGYSIEAVKRILRKYGIKETNRISEDEVKNYRRLRESGMSIENIAKRFHRAKSSVREHLAKAGNAL